MYTFEFYEEFYWSLQGQLDAQRGNLSLAPTLEGSGISEDAIEAYREGYADNATTDVCKEAAGW